jgi:hypothetical protein
MKKSNCCIIECNNLTKCENTCCGKIEICAQDASNNTCDSNKKVIIKINENSFHELIKKVKCDIKTNDFDIISGILIGLYFYIYIQFKNGYKNNILCVIQGKIDVTTLIAIDNTLNIQMCYNLYNSVKNACLDKKLAKHLKIIQVLYSTFDDLFILLIKSHDKTILGKIEHLEAIHSVGTSIDFVNSINGDSCHSCHSSKSHESCNLFIIEHIPVSICAISKGKYKITVFDKCHKQNKCFIICF